MRPQEAGRLAQPDSQRGPQQLAIVHDPRYPDPDGQQRAALPHPADPGGDHVRVEGNLADDVGGHRLLLEHRLDGGLVADELMALRVARYADLAEAVAELAHGG